MYIHFKLCQSVNAEMQIIIIIIIVPSEMLLIRRTEPAAAAAAATRSGSQYFTFDGDRLEQRSSEDVALLGRSCMHKTRACDAVRACAPFVR